MVPAFGFVNKLGGFESNVDVAALESKIKPSSIVFDEIESNFMETLLLQIGNDGLANHVGPLHHLHYKIKSTLEKSQFEQVLGRIDCHCTAL